MAVTITNEELDIFNKHGFKDTDVQATVENYRSQGLDDTAIRAKVQAKLDSWATPKATAKPNPMQSDKDQKVAEIIAKGEAERKAIDEEYKQAMGRIGVGAALQGLSALPINKIPFAGSALGGALYDAGGAIIEGKSGADIAKRAARGAAAGATIEGAIKAIPLVGKPLAKSNVGKTVINKTNELVKPLTDKASQIIKPVLASEAAQKIGQELTKERTLPQIIKKTEKPLPKATPVAEKIAENVTAPKAEEVAKASAETKERAAVKTIGKYYGKDTAEEITDKTYKTRGLEVAKTEYENLPPEKQLELINSVDDTSDVATYAKANYLKNEINNGNVPVATINKWVRLGTKKGQELQAQQFLAPDTLEGAIVQMQNAIYKAQPKNAQNLLDNAGEIANKIKKMTPEQKEKEIEKLLAEKAIKPAKRKNFVDKILKLDELGGINEENLTRLINKEFNIPEINADDITKLGQHVESINKAGNLRDKDIATQLMAKTINNKLPKNLADIDQTYRTINMLLSPKSRAKDAIGTALYQGERFLDEAFAKIPAMYSRARGFKTRDLGFENKEWLQGLKRGAKEVHEDIQLGINTGRSGEGARFDLTKTPQFEGVPVLEQAEKALNYAIRGVDRPFYEAAYEASLANQLKAQGLAEPTEEIIEQAIKEAQQAVFQRNGMLAEQGLKLREALNFKGTPLEKLRLGQRNIPFLQTVSNLAQEGLNSTPFTLPSNLYKYLNAKTIGELRDAELALGKNLKGATLYAPLGYALAQNPEKTNIGELNSLESNGSDITGMPAQGIVVGDKAFSLANMPQATIPTAIYKNLFEGDTIGEGLAKGSLQAITSLSDLPALKGVGDIAKGTGDVVKAISAEAQGQNGAIDNATSRFLKQYLSNQIGQYVPFGGALGNIRNAIDPSKRELTTDNTNVGLVQYVGNRIANRLPLVSQNLPQKYNVLGEPSLNTNIQNPIARTAGELIDPFSIRNYSPEPQIMQDLETLKKSAKANDIYGANSLNFRKAEKKINGKQLTGQEISEYQRVLGQMNALSIEGLMQSPYYQQLPEDEKVKEINSILTYNNKLVKNKLFDVPMDAQANKNKVERKIENIQSKVKSIRKKRYKQEANNLYDKIVGGN